MLNYQFARLQDNGTWLVTDFISHDDDDAVTYGLRNRTDNICALYQADRLLATFDGVERPVNAVAPAIAQRASNSLCAEVW